MVNGETNRLRYRVSLIEVACRSLAAYITIESAARGRDALCADKKSLNAILVLALGFRKLMEEPVNDLNKHSAVPWMNNNSTKSKRGRPRRACSSSQSSMTQTPQHTFKQISGLSLDSLQPPPSKQKEVLDHMLLNLTAEEFNAKMFRNCNTVNANMGLDVLGNQNNRIEADESECVFDFSEYFYRRIRGACLTMSESRKGKHVDR